MARTVTGIWLSNPVTVVTTCAAPPAGSSGKIQVASSKARSAGLSQQWQHRSGATTGTRRKSGGQASLAVLRYQLAGAEMIMKHIYVRNAALSLAALAGAATFAAPVAKAAEPAAWKDHDLVLDYFGFTTRYSCDGLRDRVRTVLLQLGARPDLSISTSGCLHPGGGVELFPSVHVHFASLQPTVAPASGAQVVAGPASGAQAAVAPVSGAPRAAGPADTGAQLGAGPAAMGAQLGAGPAAMGAQLGAGPAAMGAQLAAVPAATGAQLAAVLDPAVHGTAASAPGAGAWKSVNLGGFNGLDGGECELADAVVRNVLPLFAVRNVNWHNTCVPHSASMSLSLRLDVFAPAPPAPAN